MLTSIETVMREFGQTLKRLAREWGFVSAFVVTLALGIGANGAIFTALNAYLLRPLPFPHADQLANVYLDSHVLPIPEGHTSAYAADYLGKTPGVAAWGLYQGGISGRTVTVMSNGQPKAVGAVDVTASLFKTLGVHPLLGRWIDSASNRPDGPREVVASYRFWQSAFGGKPDAIGQSLKIDGAQYIVVGVMPRSFTFPNRSVLLWRSLTLTPAELSAARLMQLSWNMIVRRAPGVSFATLSTTLNTELTRITTEVPSQNLNGFKPYVGVASLRQWFGGATGGRLLLMQLGAALLLILAAANLGNLTLVRTLRRQHELGLRVVLGAGRFALLRIALLETLPLGIAAAVLGWFLSRIGAQALANFGVASGQTAFAAGSGRSVALFGVLLALIVAFIALAAPLLLIRARHLTALLQPGSRSATGGKGSRRTRKGLSVAQIALAVMLLSASALVGLSLQRMLGRDPGFDPNNLTVATVKLTGPAYQSYAQTVAAWRAAQSAAAALPGVHSAGVGEGVPFTGNGSISEFSVANQGGSTSNPGLTAPIIAANPGLLKALKARLLYGRLLTSADAQSDAHVVVVDATLAQGLFNTTDVVGREIQSNGYNWRIIGVVAPIKDRFTRDTSSNFRGRVIVPPAQTAYYIWIGSSLDIVMRSPLPPTVLLQELKPALTKVLPGQAITQVTSMHDLIGEATQGTSALATLLIAFGLISFVLASVGTYGVVAYLTRVRQREFAIRVALGARPWQIEWLVVGQGVALWAAGTVVGIGCTFLFGHFLSAELFGVSLLSPLAYIAPALVLGAIVTLASWLPARRVRRTALAETLSAQ